MAWLKKHLPPTPQDQDQRIATLIEQLHSDDFKRRAAAMRDLQKLGTLAEAALEDMLVKSLSLESQRRAQVLLDGLRAAPVPAAELRQVRAVHVLHWIGNEEARALLKTLTQGSPLSRQTRAARAILVR